MDCLFNTFAGESIRKGPIFRMKSFGLVSVCKRIWCQVFGELWSMVLATPGGRGLFSAL